MRPNTRAAKHSSHTQKSIALAPMLAKSVDGACEFCFWCNIPPLPMGWLAQKRRTLEHAIAFDSSWNTPIWEKFFCRTYALVCEWCKPFVTWEHHIPTRQSTKRNDWLRALVCGVRAHSLYVHYQLTMGTVPIRYRHSHRIPGEWSN